jgi:diaminopimelate epimerase
MPYFIEFTKMNGLGNDFIIIDKTKIPESLDLASLINFASHRHTGIGCDQFIIFDKISNNLAEMIIYNSDGTSAKACGNASRCLAYLLYEVSGSKKINIKVQDRILECEVNGKNKVSVNMGTVSFDEPWIPAKNDLTKELGDYLSPSSEFICADIGNPHLVIIDNILSQSDYKLIGSKFEKHNLFPDGVNVNFVSLKSNKLHLKVWERGAGFTYACGSGACVSFVASRKLGYAGDEAEVVFELGTLYMKYVDECIIMEGSISKTAEGKLIYDI